MQGDCFPHKQNFINIKQEHTKNTNNSKNPKGFCCDDFIRKNLKKH